MRDRVEFWWDHFGAPTMRTLTGYFRDLGSELVSDIQTYAPDCLELLQCIDDVASGRSASEEYEGNSYVLHCTPAGVTAESLGPVPSATTYTFDEARAVIVQYFDFLAPSPEEKKRHLATWARENGRSFPGCDRLNLSD